MRKLILAFIIIALFAGGFFLVTMRRVFGYDSDNISIQVRESEKKYRFYASYQRYKTKRIQRYMDEELNHNKKLFRYARIDADMRLDNNIFVHVKSRPGLLVIDLDKTRNDSMAYYKIKDFGERIKQKLGEDN